VVVVVVVVTVVVIVVVVVDRSDDEFMSSTRANRSSMLAEAIDAIAPSSRANLICIAVMSDQD